VSVFPLNVAQNMIRSHPLVFHPLSRPPKPIEAAMTWLRRLDNQPAHAWLRDVITGVPPGQVHWFRWEAAMTWLCDATNLNEGRPRQYQARSRSARASIARLRVEEAALPVAANRLTSHRH
jgi:hypothetical protein